MSRYIPSERFRGIHEGQGFRTLPQLEQSDSFLLIQGFMEYDELLVAKYSGFDFIPVYEIIETEKDFEALKEYHPKAELMVVRDYLDYK